MGPVALLPPSGMDCREPERLTHRLEGAKIAPRANDAVVETDILSFVREHGLDLGIHCLVPFDLFVPNQLQNLAPDELHSNGTLQDRLKGEGQRAKVAWLHI